jgi:toxin YoeB
VKKQGLFEKVGFLEISLLLWIYLSRIRYTVHSCVNNLCFLTKSLLRLRLEQDFFNYSTELPKIIRVSPGFTTKFKEDLGWWFRNDNKKAAKILDLATAVMSDPFTGIGKPEALKYTALFPKSLKKSVRQTKLPKTCEAQIHFLFV